MTDKPKFYFENLDGLRALAALAVILMHSSWLPTPEDQFHKLVAETITFSRDGGRLGVKFFFVLSGFLITYLLLREHLKVGKIRLGHFYVRRFLRIWPLYYLSIFIGFVAYPVLLAPPDFQEVANPIWYSVFLSNFDNLYSGLPTCGILGVQWSVAIEEQFYLFWPLIIMAVLKIDRRLAPVTFVILTLASEVFYLQQVGKGPKLLHLFSEIRYLAFGGLLGYLCFYHEKRVRDWLARLGTPLTIVIYLVSVSAMFFGPDYGENSRVLKLLVHALPFIFFGFVIVEQNYSSCSFFKMKNYPRLTYLGKISYGLYSLHMVAVYIIISVPFLNDARLYIPNTILLVLLSIAISHISFFYFEERFLRLKKAFTPKAKEGSEAKGSA